MKRIVISILCLAGILLAGCAAPAQISPETTAAATAPTECPTEPEEAVVETTEAATLPEPEPTEYVLSFVGDCCLANLKGWSKDAYFMGTVGEDYAYPFAGVKEYFEADECTFINLENPLTERGSAAGNPFVFRGPPVYTRILTEGSVEFANVVNNHAMDYGEEGYLDTLAALDEAGIRYAEQKQTLVFTTENGLTIGIYTDLHPQKAEGFSETVASLRDQGAEIVIFCFHWGQEYFYKPNSLQTELGHAAIDAGADIVYGHHSHILQPVEEYGSGVIFYSLGNFCFGGNTNPDDKDSAILQQTVIREPDGSVHLGELTRIPCCLSSVQTHNDFQPTPYDPESAEYLRTLSKLDGSWEKTQLSASNRPELG